MSLFKRPARQHHDRGQPVKATSPEMIEALRSDARLLASLLDQKLGAIQNALAFDKCPKCLSTQLHRTYQRARVYGGTFSTDIPNPMRYIGDVDPRLRAFSDEIGGTDVTAATALGVETLVVTCGCGHRVGLEWTADRDTEATGGGLR